MIPRALGWRLSKNGNQYADEHQKENQADNGIVVLGVVKNLFPAFFAHKKSPAYGRPDGMKDDSKNKFSKKSGDKFHYSICAWPTKQKRAKAKGSWNSFKTMLGRS